MGHTSSTTFRPRHNSTVVFAELARREASEATGQLAHLRVLPCTQKNTMSSHLHQLDPIHAMEVETTAMNDVPPGEASAFSAGPKAEEEAPSLLPTIVLHDSGDVILRVGTEAGMRQPVLVSKMVMVQASPVWKAMFERHWKESDATEIPLPDDDIEAILLVLRIAHLRFKEIPQRHNLTIDALLNLAVVCDKYDLVKLVQPFLDLHGWAQYHLPNIRSEKNCNPSWFFVAWTFGYNDSFEALATYLVRRIKLDADGNAITQNGQRFPSDTPPGLLGMCF